MEEKVQDILRSIDEEIIFLIEDNEILLTKEEWQGELKFQLDEGNTDIVLENIQNHFENWRKLQSIATNSNENIIVWFDGQEAILINEEEWSREVSFKKEDDDTDDTIIERVSNFFDLKYIPVKCCFKNDYFEVLVNHNEIIWGDGLSSVSFGAEESEAIESKIHYEISNISYEFARLIENNQNYRDLEVEDSFSTLKIYNINKATGIKIDSEGFIEKLYYYAKCVLFDLSFKYSTPIKFDELPEDDENDVYFEDNTDELNKINDPYVKKQYDPDLIDYYHRALVMAESEFKYLAFYQVLECIFDEVYQHETVQDVKQIINSSWFSPHDNNDISTIIEVIDKYNKSKNDREKLKLVLERYFKGEVHEHAYYIANKDVIEILQKDLKKINKDTDINDLQKLSSILYDFRCECTHSNRAYPFRTSFNNTNQELSKYIELIKKVAERIIINYPNNL